FIEKKKQLVALESEFSKNLVEWKDELHVTTKELEGLPATFIDGLEKTSDGKYKLTMAYPHYYTFMENAKDADARRRMEAKFNNRGGSKNKKLLEQAIQL